MYTIYKQKFLDRKTTRHKPIHLIGYVNKKKANDCQKFHKRM